MINKKIPDIKIPVPQCTAPKGVRESAQLKQAETPASESIYQETEQTIAEINDDREYLMLLGPQIMEKLEGHIFIGSDANLSDVVLQGDYARFVSGRHCEITQRSSGFYLEDCESTNGTLVNGRKLRSPKKMKLAPGDVIRLGNTELNVERQ